MTRQLRLAMSGSAATRGSITSLGTSLGAPGLHRMLMCVKARVSPSSEISLSRKASCTLNLTWWLIYELLNSGQGIVSHHLVTYSIGGNTIDGIRHASAKDVTRHLVLQANIPPQAVQAKV